MRSTTVVHGRLAMRRERLDAARQGRVGAQVLAIEHVAARLAGGFHRLVDMPLLRETVAAVMPEVDLGELEPIKDLPGMPSAAATTLMRLWLSGISLDGRVGSHRRLDSVAALEAAVRDALPVGVLCPQGLAAAARARIAHAPAVVGPVTVRGMTELHPVWRPLLADLARTVGVTWDGGPRPQPGWLDPAVTKVRAAPSMPMVASVSCATPRHEVIEAIRWMRSLMSSGVPAADIAVAAASCSEYDEHFEALARESGLPIHFDHGHSALNTPDGQSAAAVADVLVRGVTQKRVRRVIALCRRSQALSALPDDWADHLPPDAALTTATRWAGALARRDHAEATSAVLLPVIELLSRGPEAAVEAGEALLDRTALAIWKRALSDGPATALDQTIRSLRTPDGTDPFSSAVFLPAEALAANPRRHVRLLGLTSRSWPRGQSEDALIPAQVIPIRELDALPVGEADRRDFATINSTTSTTIVLSWPRRDAEGRVLGIGPLVPDNLRMEAQRLQRTRVPVHAMSEADRLFARPSEFVGRAAAVSAQACWTDWRSSSVTAHDGLVRADHPRIAKALRLHQSATSLRMLLRDPLGFTWQYALGFRAPEFEDEPLALDTRQFGNLVHAVLRRTVDTLEHTGGLADADAARLTTAIGNAVMDEGARMETSQPIPPALIWRGTLDMAESMTLAALGHGLPPLPGQRSYTEVPFGGGEARFGELPWDPETIVRVPGTDLRIRGFIDRLDLAGDGQSARVLDYKSGRTPKNASQIVLKGGSELQRCIYGFAVKALLGEEVEVESGLLYPRGREYAPLADAETTLTQLSAFLSTAVSSMRAGRCLPGTDAADDYNDLAFALPANARATYLRRKRDAVLTELGPVADVWEAA